MLLGTEWSANDLDEDSHSLREHRLATTLDEAPYGTWRIGRVYDIHALPTGTSSDGGEGVTHIQFKILGPRC